MASQSSSTDSPGHYDRGRTSPSLNMGSYAEPQGKILNIAVAGLGRMGKRHVSTLLARVPRARVVAVCSAAPHETEWAQSNTTYQDLNIATYATYDDMLRHPGLQAVWISTSTDVHSIQTIKAVEKGLHVLCEKPLSTDLDEISAAIAAANSRPDLKVMAGFSRRFDASYRDAYRKAQSGTIGSPYLVRSNTCDLLDHSGFFVAYAKRNGGIFVDCTIHDIDLALWFLDNPAPKTCFAVGTLTHHPELAESNDVDNGVAIVEFHGGKIAYFHASRTQAHGHDVCTEVTGTEGKLMINVIPRANNVVVADKSGMRHEVQPEYWQRFEEAFATEAREFVECVLEGKEVPVALENGFMAVKIGRALQESLIEGKVVRFDENGKRVG